MASADYVAAVDRHLEGVYYFSVGPCEGCSECGLPQDPTDDEYDMAMGGSYSWSACDGCGSSLGGDRYPAHGVLVSSEGEEQVEHFQVCQTCLCYHANGDVPEDWR